jgi:ferredoxin-NADP reductase
MTTALAATESVLDADEFTLTVVDRMDLADGIIGITLGAPEGQSLPSWEPGAHVQITVEENGRRFARSYSLCGDPDDRRHYRIAVLHCVDGNGGSAAVHRVVQPGVVLPVSRPRNMFEFRPDAGRPVLFIAGGIGVTPLLPMVREAVRRGLDWQALYLGRNPSVMALGEDLAGYAAAPQQVRIHHSDVDGILDLAELVASFPEGVQVYTCGPEPLLSALTDLHAQGGGWDLQLERFAAPVTAAVDTAFEVVAESTGETYPVPAGCSVLEVLRQKGFDVEFSCATGVCGTCETVVLEGEPEHRDAVLTEEERASNETMMICVSRAKSARLVLDI